MRFLRGGRIDDGGRLPRYVGLFLLGAAAIWAPITGYLGTAPERFTSEMSLILPGSGASASVNLSDIGQASSNASSPFSSSSVSPTVTYKRLIGADRILDGADGAMGIGRHEFGAPRVELIDQTSLVRVRMVGNSPHDAQARGHALIAAFFQELDALRTDELDVRETGGEGAIGEFRDSVARTRIEIDRLQRDTGLISAALACRLGQMRDSLSEQAKSARALQAALGSRPPSPPPR